MEQKPQAAAEAPHGEGEGHPVELVEHVEPVQPAAEITKYTWVTWAAVCTCVALFIGVNLQENKYSWEVLSKFGFLPAEEIWAGAWWGTLTSTFLHIDLVHAFFNLYWLWHLGRLIEDQIGSLRLLVFYLGASIIGATAQLATSDTTGIGASGVVYAMFGFMWRTRFVYPKFQSIMVPRTIKVFLIWLVACFFLTAAKIMNIANAAHVAGLVCGAVVAECFVLRRPRLPYAVGTLFLAGLSLVPLWWVPWSITWQGVKAFDELEAGRREDAIQRLNAVIKKHPKEARAYEQRAKLYVEMEDLDKAVPDFRKAQELTSSGAEKK